MIMLDAIKRPVHLYMQARTAELLRQSSACTEQGRAGQGRAQLGYGYSIDSPIDVYRAYKLA